MKITRSVIHTYEEEIPDNLEGFKNWEFSSGSTTGQDFNLFQKEFKKHIKKILLPGMELINFGANHYYLSGFIKKEKKFFYFSISDVRHFPGNWFRNILIRTAKSEKDYTGGSNNSTTLENFVPSIDRLFQDVA